MQPRALQDSLTRHEPCKVMLIRYTSKLCASQAVATAARGQLRYKLKLVHHKAKRDLSTLNTVQRVEMGPPGTSEVIMSKALSVVLQHPAVAADQQNICRLVQVCKAWKTGVQQSHACVTNVNFSRQLPYTGDAHGRLIFAAGIIAEVGEFARWLSVYAGTVGSLHLNIQFVTGSITLRKLEKHAQQVLALSLKAAAAAGQTSARSCSTSSPAGAGAAPPLQLHSFTCSNHLASPYLVSALPAAALTHLKISAPSNALVYDGLGNLSNLRSLDLRGSGGHISNDFLSRINKLSKLISLRLGIMQNIDGLASLPHQLTKLDLDIHSSTSGHLDLSHFTQLQELTAQIAQRVEALTLPQQLQSLKITCPNPVLSVSNVTALQQLQQLTIHNAEEPVTDLLLLTQMQQLKRVELSYSSSECAVVAAPVWVQLRQLVALHLDCVGNAVLFQTLLDGLHPLTSLTALTFQPYWEDEEDEAAADAQAVEAAADAQAVEDATERMSSMSQTLKHLTNLRDLELDLTSWVDLQDGDLMHLSNLTGLTRLSLRANQLGDGITVNVILLELTKLQHLTFGASIELSVLPVIAKLQELTYLSLSGLSEQGVWQGLQLFTRLRNLRELHGFGSCSRASMKQFWATLRAAA